MTQPSTTAGLTTFYVSQEVYDRLHDQFGHDIRGDYHSLGMTVAVFGLYLALGKCHALAGTCRREGNDVSVWADLIEEARELLADHALLDSVVVVPRGTSSWVILHERGHAFVGRTSILAKLLSRLDVEEIIDVTRLGSAAKKVFRSLYGAYKPAARATELFVDLYAWHVADEETRRELHPEEDANWRLLRSAFYNLLEVVGLFGSILRKAGLDPDRLPLRANPGR